jgi:HK97 family phage major capsid protein
MTMQIEYHGAGAKKDLAAVLMSSVDGRAKLNDPEFRAGLARSKEGRAALAKIEKAQRSSAAKIKRSARTATPATARSGYGADSHQSFFRDLVRVAYLDQRWSTMINAGVPMNMMGEEAFPIPGDGTLAEARSRVQHELRSITSTSGGGGFAAPGWVGNLIDTAARTEGRLMGLVTVDQRPGPGLALRLPVQTSPAVTDVTPEGSAVTATDITTDTQTATGVVIAGEVNVTQALLDNGGGIVDQQISRDLGADLARKMDQQIISGTGSGELAGLLAHAGITETTYTDATPTVPEYRAAAWTLARDVQVASGLEVDTMIVSPTRHSWLQSGIAANSRQVLGQDFPAKPLPVGSVPLNLGSGTNEDRLLAWRKDRVVLHLTPLVFRAVVDSSLSGSLTVRLQAYTLAHLHLTRPSAVGVLKGTGCVVPTL